jgi:hypothetical protein
MEPFATVLLHAQQNVRARQTRLWLECLDVALKHRGIDADRRGRWAGALTRYAMRPDLLRPGQVQTYIEEQVQSGGLPARNLIDLIQALSFFYDSVVEQRKLAGEAGHPFDPPAEEWAIDETIVVLSQRLDKPAGRSRAIDF